jgi:hypothetical protein
MAKHRQVIGDNPLDILIQPKNRSAEVTTEEAQLEHNSSKQAKQRITVQISVDVIERIKNAVYWTPGLTLAALAEEAFAHAVNKLEKERGATFNTRKEELKTGRPIK